MTTEKEYKKLRKEHDFSDERLRFHYNPFWESCAPDSLKDLQNDIRQIQKDGEGIKLKGSYDRAAIIYHTNNSVILRSYYTDIAVIYKGKFYKIWKGFTVTTLKHINLFREENSFPTLNKREWIELPVYENVIDNETGEVIY